MTKEQIAVKDILHLYLGCEVISVLNGQACDGELIEVSKRGCSIMDKRKNIPVAQYDLDAVALILYPLSSMTEEEGAFIVNNYSFRGVDMPLNKKLFGIEIAKRLSEQMSVAAYLLSKHFDLFDLIPSGLAIDATTINNLKPFGV